MSQPVPHEPIDVAQEEGTGLPGLRSWKGVYIFVLGVFVTVVVALAVFTEVFS